MPSGHMHCGGIWDLTQVHLGQKLAIEYLLHYPSYSQGDIFSIKNSHRTVDSYIQDSDFYYYATATDWSELVE